MPGSREKTVSFNLQDENGRSRSFEDLVGRKGLVMYVYPRDSTSGCTLEAKEFSERLASFRRRGYNVVGVSKDSVSSHSRFIEKSCLSIPLLSDPEASLIKGLGAWGEKKMAGRTFHGTVRSTFVLDMQGKIIKAYFKVKAKGHAEQVLEDLDSLK